MYHFPGKKEGLNINGMVGEVIKVIVEPLSANFPIKVQFKVMKGEKEMKAVAHLVSWWRSQCRVLDGMRIVLSSTNAGEPYTVHPVPGVSCQRRGCCSTRDDVSKRTTRRDMPWQRFR